MASNNGSRNTRDGAQHKVPRNVSFADDFDPRGLDAKDAQMRSSINRNSDGPRSRAGGHGDRKGNHVETVSFSDLLDEDENPRSSLRSPSSYGPVASQSRPTVPPPHGWHPSGVFYRFTILGTVAFILLAGYFADETIGATTSELRAQMKLTPKEIGWIYSAGYGPNIIMVFIGGVLVDKFGVRLMSVIYSALVVIGLTVFAITPTLWGKILGRIIFGAGFEPMEVSADAIVMRWYAAEKIDSKDSFRRFKVGAPSIPLAFSLLFSTGIIGQFLSLNVLPAVLAAFKKNLLYVYLLVAAVGLAALVVNIVFAVMDWIGSRKLELESTASESISFKVLTHFPLTYWLLMGVCVAGYSCQYMFMIYASDYIHEKWGYDDIQSGNWASVVYLFAIVGSPLVGYFIEVHGQALTLMGMGCLFFAIGSVIMGAISPTNTLPAVPLVLMGIAYSLVPATVWSSLSYVIPEPLAGTGFGVMTAVMSFTYLVIPSAVGVIHDFYHSYDYMNYVFAVCALISFGGVIWVAKIEPDLNLSPRARRRDLAAYNVLHTGLEGGEDSDDEDYFNTIHTHDGRSPKTRLEDDFVMIRDRFAGPMSPQRGSHLRKSMSDTEMHTVTEEEYKLTSDEEHEHPPGFSSSLIPDSWLHNLKRGSDPANDPVSGSLPTEHTYL